VLPAYPACEGKTAVKQMVLVAVHFFPQYLANRCE